MKLVNAIKKLSKYGEVRVNGQEHSTIINGIEVSFMVNGRIEDDYGITCINVRNINDENDSMTDYCAGTFCDNLTQAIRMALR